LWGRGGSLQKRAPVDHAAVVIPVARYEEPRLIFVRRAAHLRRNPGQIAFPGGIVDDDDADPQAAAVREFQEELGIAAERLTVVERLEDVVTLALSVTVSPYVARVDPPLYYAFDPSETAAVHEIPLAALYANGALHEGIERGVVHNGKTYDVPSLIFDYEDVHVWGATAQMLRRLTTRFTSVDTLMATVNAAG